MTTETLSESLGPHIDPKNGHHRPNDKHYGHGYRWDETQISMGYSETGEPELGAKGVEQVLSWQNPNTGFIPNIKLTPHRWFDPERWTYKNPFKESDYPQPPLESDAANRAYNAYINQGRGNEGREFLVRNYDALKKGILYFPKVLENRDSALVGVFHPSATGRDSCPDSDFGRPGRLPVFGKKTPEIIYRVNTVIDYLSQLRLNVRLRAVNWDIEKAREIFWMNDVMFNCIYANNLEIMGEIAQNLGKAEDKEMFNKKSLEVTQAIMDHMWKDKSGFFHSLNTEGKPIENITISNTYPITLAHLDKAKTRAIVDILKDPDLFGTTFQFPSVPANSKYYDPGRREKRLWRGTNWLNSDLHLIEGLMHKYEKFKETDAKLSTDCFKVASSSAKAIIWLVENSGPWECFDSDSGEGKRLKPFAWTIAVYYHVKAKYPQLLAA